MNLFNLKVTLLMNISHEEVIAIAEMLSIVSGL
jgi:hypothetical protein